MQLIIIIPKMLRNQPTKNQASALLPFLLAIIGQTIIPEMEIRKATVSKTTVIMEANNEGSKPNIVSHSYSIFSVLPKSRLKATVLYISIVSHGNYIVKHFFKINCVFAKRKQNNGFVWITKSQSPVTTPINKGRFVALSTMA